LLKEQALARLFFVDPIRDRAEPVSDVELPSRVRGKSGTFSYVDLYLLQAWLISDGEVIRGSVPISAGGPGAETPVGTFTVLWKERLHISVECNNTPMPHSVFFTSGGVAFHFGSLERPSAGCVKLAREDAEIWFESLEVGDEILVHGSEVPAERACRINLPARRGTFTSRLRGLLRWTAHAETS
jgi:hypothetical protein